MFRTIITFVLFTALLPISTIAQILDQATVVAAAERAYDKAAKGVTMPAPGCAAAVSLNGQSVFEKAFGLAEMEHRIPNTPQTIFESGSVAKQFTAAALALLAQEGKLNLDDPIKKYIPELPDYDKPITIRHALNHTAGLRDWGTVLGLTGAGRGDRVITQDLALDVIVHQKALDFTPGAEYSYSNSGYQLAAIIIERVSKQKFAAFVEERLFKPVGMTKSSWRDDYQRVVPGRAQGYSRQGNGPWRLNMPFMNVVGNGGMLTTVGDWMKWNAMLDSRSLGAPLVESLETVGILNDGKKITYALGLNVDRYKGIREVSHGGSTAGYQTFLARYPDKKISIGVLCNGTSPSASALTASIADEIFGPFPDAGASAAATLSAGELQKFAGLWREEKTRAPGRTVIEGDTLRFNGSPIKPQGDGSFLLGSEIRIQFKFDKDGKPISFEGNYRGDVRRYIRETEWTPTASELAPFAGEWYSEEAGARFSFVVDGDKPVLKQRPALRFQLRPIYKDHFDFQGYVIWFTRDASGKVDKMHIGTTRMRDMHFVRIV